MLNLRFLFILSIKIGIPLVGWSKINILIKKLFIQNLSEDKITIH